MRSPSASSTVPQMSRRPWPSSGSTPRSRSRGPRSLPRSSAAAILALLIGWLPFPASASALPASHAAADCVPSVGPGIPPPASVPSGLPGFHAAWVGPNQAAWFQFAVIAPQVPGTYRLSIRPLIEGAQWMEDYGVFWYVTVAGTAPVGALAPLPAKWPSRALEIGMTDGANGAAALRATAPFAFRYH